MVTDRRFLILKAINQEAGNLVAGQPISCYAVSFTAATISAMIEGRAEGLAAQLVAFGGLEVDVMRLPSLFVLVIVSGTAAVTARADRPVEHRMEADYVIVGNVDAVYVRDAGSYWNYIVELKVEGVEKGNGLKPGDTFRALCYQHKPGKGGFFDDAGHDAVPKEGQRIKAYISRGNGRHEGVYPNWFDAMPAGRKRHTRQRSPNEAKHRALGHGHPTDE